MSELLTAAATALGTPEAIVQRSAEARATASGTSVDEVLEAWAGGAAVATTTAPPDVEEEAPPAEPETELETTEEGSPPPGAAEPLAEPVAAPEPKPVVVAALEKAEEPLSPVALRTRLRSAIRIGAWTGAALGFLGFVFATTWWAPNATITGDEALTPAVIVETGQLILYAALVSLLFGATVASISRAGVGWIDPAMQLRSRPATTALAGAGLGAVLGVVGGSALSAFGTSVEDAEVATMILPIVPALIVIAVGGAVLGAVTAGMTQVISIPRGLAEGEEEELDEVRHRIGGAIGVPLAGAALLGLLVLPIAWTFIRSNELTSGGAAIVAILAASGILGFAALAGSKPNMRISLGEFLVALIGLATVVAIIFAVLNTRGGGDEHADTGDAEAAAVLVTD